ARDPVVPRALRTRYGRRYRVPDRRLDQITTDPPTRSAEIEHLRRVGNARMRALRIAMGFEPYIEVGVRLRVHLVTEHDTDTLARIFLVQLLCHFAEFLLAATVIAHQDDALEAGLDQLFDDLLVE